MNAQLYNWDHLRRESRLSRLSQAGQFMDEIVGGSYEVSVVMVWNRASRNFQRVKGCIHWMLVVIGTLLLF